MRIVIDLQGCQASSRNRGMGRYSMALAQAIIRNKGEHDVHLALNGAFRETLTPIRKAFQGLLPAANIHVWKPLTPAFQVDPANRGRRLASEYGRELFLSQLNPDIIHVSSLFEGFGDDAICSIGALQRHIPTAVTLYDLIPLLNPDPYFQNKAFERWYLDRIDHLRRADLLLAISESTRAEGIDALGFRPDRCVNVGTAADPQFGPLSLSEDQQLALRRSYGLDRPFVLYTGGIDHRKNIERLIRAYGALPEDIRSKHQLAIVCSVQEQDRKRLTALALESGVGPNGFVMTGFVPEDDLIALYNMCRLFVFPSWHEGFGLPALEAMMCGAPVIGSNRSSLPEVIGLEEATFDPFDEKAITAAIHKPLVNESFRRRLIKHAASHAKTFSWDEAGKRSIDAFEALVAERSGKSAEAGNARPRLAYVSPIPPAKSGIADYSAELLPELSRHYAIDLVVQNDKVGEIDYPLAGNTLPVVPASRFAASWRDYDRVLYHFGNSDHHEHMFDLLATTSGVVVLHDFFLSGIVAHREWHGAAPRSWQKELYRSHGYAGPLFRTLAPVESDAVWKLPCSYSVIENALSVIVHSENSKRLAAKWYGEEQNAKLSLVPHLRAPPAQGYDRASARKELDVAEDMFVLCSFGMIGPTKLNHLLLEAWDASSLSRSTACRLIFVGQNDFGAYGQDLTAKIQKGQRRGKVSITGWADQDTYRRHLAAADLAVQLRCLSRGETSGTVLDCMTYGVPLVVNANGAMADLPREAITILEDDVTVDALVGALEKLHSRAKTRQAMSKAGKAIIEERHGPAHCADLYRDVIESGYRELGMIGRFISGVARAELSDGELVQISAASSRALSKAPSRLFIDISELALADARTGIQRVVRNTISALFSDTITDLRIEPIYVDKQIARYRYARSFMTRFLDVDIGELEDEVVDFTERDTLLLLDLNPNGLPAIEAELERLNDIGVRTIFVVYDLLPIKLPDCFVPGADTNHRQWLRYVARGAKALCISAAVADDLKAYLHDVHPESSTAVDHYPLGSELEPSRLIAHETIKGEAGPVDFSKPTFLMVGTIEPRKGHAEVIDAFEKLWSVGHDINLCVVGKQGWMVEKLVEHMSKLSAREPRFIWRKQISDAELGQVYKASTCLIAASLDEGFGLPLAEAAQLGIPLIVRNIPVFRELCGDSATYFSHELGRTVTDWLKDYDKGQHVASAGVRVVSWTQSAKALMDLIEQ